MASSAQIAVVCCLESVKGYFTYGEFILPPYYGNSACTSELIEFALRTCANCQSGPSQSLASQLRTGLLVVPLDCNPGQFDGRSACFAKPTHHPLAIPRLL